MEVLYFSKNAKSLHFGEYPAKVHWPEVPDPVSNPCCQLVADIIGKDYALVDLAPIRSKGLSGDIKFKEIRKELMQDSGYTKALEVYFKCSIEYFNVATVFPVWGQEMAKLMPVFNLDVILFPMAHPSGHGKRSCPSHHLKVILDLQTVQATIISPTNVQEYLRVILSDEAKRVEAHKNTLEELGMQHEALLLRRSAILHLVELEWSKRIELIVLLKERHVKRKILEIFFCVSLRFRNAQVITTGIEKIAVALHSDFAPHDLRTDLFCG